jgi:predicted phage terminase large subunit-like protein
MREGRTLDNEQQLSLDAQADLAARELLTRRNARSSLLNFIQYTYPNFIAKLHHLMIIDKLEQVLAGKIKRLMLWLPPRHGKLCANSTPVLTTAGWKTHGDLRIGDQVFGPSGRPVSIIAVGDPQACNARVTFRNGEVVDCHLDHEWTFFDRSTWKTRTEETRFFLNLPKTSAGRERKILDKTRSVYQLPLIDALQFSKRDLPLHPYVLGAWLGDGTSSASNITFAESDRPYIDKIVSLGYGISKERKHPETGCMTVTLAAGNRGPKHPGKLFKGLKTLNVLNNKHIPEIYKISSVEQRLELMAGLIDTDGNMGKDGRVRVVTSMKILADDVKELAISLGWNSHIQTLKADPNYCHLINGRPIYWKHDAYVVDFKPTCLIPVALERKKVTKFSKRIPVGFEKVEEIHDGELGHCIQVDSEDGLYLIGKSLIPTHNSLIASRRLPAFFLARNPDKQVLMISYQERLAKVFSKDVRNTIGSVKFKNLFPNVAVSPNSRAAGLWNTTQDGGFLSAGIGGGKGTGVTGFGADLLICDDIIKGRKDAASETILTDVNNSLQSDVMTRLHPGAAVVYIGTRWAHNDPAGEIIRNDTENEWTILKLPALAEANDPLGRKVGEALWPERYPEKYLLSLRNNPSKLGVAQFESLYQQNPTIAEGAIFQVDKFRRWNKSNLPSQFDLEIVSMDTNVSVGEGNDLTCIQHWGKSGALFYLLDQVKGNWGMTQQLNAFRIFCDARPWVGAKLVEKKANGAAIMDMLARWVPGLVPVLPTESKVQRALAIEPYVSSGNIYIPETKEADWVEDFILECRQFPMGRHDDQIDTCTQAVTYMAKNGQEMADISSALAAAYR